MEMSELLNGASLEELKRGYREEEDRYLCICCGAEAEKGIIYPEDGVLLEAYRYIRRHVEKEHGSPFGYLLSLDKSVTGLSDVQRGLLELLYQGGSDAEVQKALGIGSASTIRNHRFILREKERQARVFLAIMELYGERDPKPRTVVPAQSGGAAPRSTPDPDGTDQGVMKKYFPQGTEGPLKRYPAKEKERRIVLAQLAERFEQGRAYSEQEVNDRLEEVYGDYAVLRRALVDYRFMDRETDGSRYWRLEREKGEAEGLSRKEELKQLAKETKIEGGIFQVRNLKNGKVLVESTRNFKTMNGHEFSLRMGSHKNKELQQEWTEYGQEAFVFEILEKLKKKETGYFDEKDELRKLKVKWLKQLGPYGDAGYNSPKEEEK
jgi:hypothetical protein